MIIRKATETDAKEIERIVKSVQLSRINGISSGFLIENKGIAGYKKAIQQARYSYVAESGKNIIGFLIAYSKESIKPVGESKKYMLNKWKSGDFVYIYQIAVSPDFKRMGIGSRLYKTMIKETPGKKKIVFTSITPYNKTSEKFHLKTGFKKIGKVPWKNGELSFVYEMD